MKIKKVLIIIFLVILVIGGVYYYNQEYKNITDKTSEKNKSKDKTNLYNSCPDGYECVKVSEETYKFSIKKSIKVENMFNFDTNLNENGTLKITDEGKLVFENESGKIIKTYDIPSKVVSIDSTNSNCDLIFALLTSDGKVYKTEDGDGLFSGDAFLEIPLDEEIKKISLYSDTCDIKLIGLNKDAEVKDLLVNE